MTKEELIELLEKMVKNAQAVEKIYKKLGNLQMVNLCRGATDAYTCVIYMLEDNDFFEKQYEIFADKD